MPKSCCGSTPASRALANPPGSTCCADLVGLQFGVVDMVGFNWFWASTDFFNQITCPVTLEFSFTHTKPIYEYCSVFNNTTFDTINLIPGEPQTIVFNPGDEIIMDIAADGDFSQDDWLLYCKNLTCGVDYGVILDLSTQYCCQHPKSPLLFGGPNSTTGNSGTNPTPAIIDTDCAGVITFYMDCSNPGNGETFTLTVDGTPYPMVNAVGVNVPFNPGSVMTCAFSSTIPNTQFSLAAVMNYCDANLYVIPGTYGPWGVNNM